MGGPSGTPIDIDDLARSPLPRTTFDTLDDLPVIDVKYVSELEKRLWDWIYRTQTMQVRVSEAPGSGGWS